MILLVGVKCDGDAFDHKRYGNAEVARILEDLAARVREGGNYFGLRDINGNPCGSAEFRRLDTLDEHDL